MTNQTFRNRLQRSTYLVLSFVILIMATVPEFFLGQAHAAGQATSRSITISSSTPSATSTTYTVSFKPTATTNIGGIVVDFCGDSPLIGSTTCTLPTGFTLGTTPAVSGLTGFSTSTGSWVSTNSLQGAAAASNFQVLKYTNTTAQTPTGTTTPISFNITTVTNPSTAGSFYARIVTFDTSANAVSQYTASGTTRAASFANQLDYGGIALSTAAAIALTARIMETLSFCVYNSSCGDSPSLIIGTGTPAAIDTGSVYTASDKFSLSTNALSGAIVNLFGDTLKSGANSLTAAGTVSAVAAGSGKFGLQIGGITTTSGSLAATTNYAGTGSNYGFVVANTTAAGGDTIANTSSGPVNGGVATLTYGATAAPTTPAGIYTATHQLIATGTF